jgi:enoyl-CoA hydratase
VRTGLAYRLIDANGDPHSPAGHEALLAAAVDLAHRAAAAPRNLVIATKATLRVTVTMPTHAQAVTHELAPQLASLRMLAK